MAQKSENFKFEGKYAEYIPAASTQISSGDAVMLTNGSYINIDDIKEGDDISMDWIKSISD
jgi:predicted RecA/RadA family phage recombinase